MAVHAQTIVLDTNSALEIVDITGRVSALVKARALRRGLVQVTTRHTTSAIRIGESEPGLIEDLKSFLTAIAPPGSGYRHDRSPVDGRRNTHSHLASFLLGASEGIAFADGELQLGTWQRIFFVELDGPRPGREVIVTVVGE